MQLRAMNSGHLAISVLLLALVSFDCISSYPVNLSEGQLDGQLRGPQMRAITGNPQKPITQQPQQPIQQQQPQPSIRQQPQFRFNPQQAHPVPVPIKQQLQQQQQQQQQAAPQQQQQRRLPSPPPIDSGANQGQQQGGQQYQQQVRYAEPKGQQPFRFNSEPTKPLRFEPQQQQSAPVVDELTKPVSGELDTGKEDKPQFDLDYSPLKPDFLRKISALSSTFGNGNFQLNNNVSKLSLGNTKVNNVSSVNHVSAPVISNSMLGSLDSKVGASSGAKDSSDSTSGDGSGSEREGKSHKGKGKKKATEEQKELKEKLIELTDKVAEETISTPEQPLLKYNPENGQFEPVKTDASTLEAKEKLKEAINAISAKKLPAQKLRKILEDDSNPSSTGGDQSQQQDNDGDLNNNGIQDDQEAESQYQPNGSSQEYRQQPQQQQQQQQPQQQPQQQQQRGQQQQPQSSQELPTLRSTGSKRSDLAEPMEVLTRTAGKRPTSTLSSDDYYTSSPSGYSTGNNNRYSSAGNGQRSSGQGGNLYGDVNSQYSQDSSLYNNNNEDDGSDEIKALLDDRLNRISDLLYFRPEFMNQLLQINDPVELTPLESEFKRMVLCNSDEQFCLQDVSQMSGLQPTDDTLYEDNQPAAEEPGNYDARHYYDELQPQYETEQEQSQQQSPVEDQQRYGQTSSTNNPTVSQGNPNVFRRTSSTRTYESVQHSAATEGLPGASQYNQIKRPTGYQSQSPVDAAVSSYGNGSNGGAFASATTTTSSTGYPYQKQSVTGSAAPVAPAQPSKPQIAVAYQNGVNGNGYSSSSSTVSSSSSFGSGAGSQRQAPRYQQQQATPARDTKQFAPANQRGQQQAYPRY